MPSPVFLARHSRAPASRATSLKKKIRSRKGKSGCGGSPFHHIRAPYFLLPGGQRGGASCSLWPAETLRIGAGQRLQDAWHGVHGVEMTEKIGLYMRRPPEGNRGPSMDERSKISRSTRASKLQREYTHDLAKDQAADRAQDMARTCGERLIPDRKMRCLMASNRGLFLRP